MKRFIALGILLLTAVSFSPRPVKADGVEFAIGLARWYYAHFGKVTYSRIPPTPHGIQNPAPEVVVKAPVSSEGIVRVRR
jgi:hypothetical protein